MTSVPDEAPERALHCLVVDDQPATLEQLARMLRAEPNVATVSTATESLAALRTLREDNVDVVFIEMRMPGMDGMELAWVLQRLRRAPVVVFVSDCMQRAAEAFDVGAVDYLCKPPSPDRLAESMRRVAAARYASGVRRDGSPPSPAGDLIPVELGGTVKLVRRSDVRWAQARGDYVRLYTADGSYLIRARLSALADCWRSFGMVRIHRSYLVQLRFLNAVQVGDAGQVTVVVGGQRLPVSRRMAPVLRGWLRGLRQESTLAGRAR